MTYTLERWLFDIARTSDPWQPAHGRYLTTRSFYLKKGIFIRRTQLETVEFPKLWMIPEPGEKLRQGNPMAGVGAS